LGSHQKREHHREQGRKKPGAAPDAKLPAEMEKSFSLFVVETLPVFPDHPGELFDLRQNRFVTLEIFQ
jgi:hypothetical protein